MGIPRCVLALFVTIAAGPALAQTWPDLTDDAGVQGGGENDAALIVGVTDYYNLPKIDGAAQNAEAWQQWLLRSRKVPSTRVELLTDKLATREKIEKNLEQLAQQVGPKGTLWFIFIGHGAPNKEGTDGLLLGVDTDADSDSLSARGVAQERALSLIGQGKQAHSVVVFDACFSGKTGDGGTTLVKGMMATLPNRKAASAPIKATVLAASDSFAGPLPNADRPAYSYLLLGALRGWADENGDKAVDVDEAHEFTRSHIQRLFKGSDRLPSKRGPSVVLAKNVREKQPDIAALVSGKCPSGWIWGARECKQRETIECPASTSWNGSTCAATTVACPEGTTWNGSACEGQRLAVVPAPPATSPPSTTGIVWVRLPGGSFHYGCEPQDTQCGINEKPGSTQSVAPFAMAQTETTVAQYNACVAAGACASGPGNDDGGLDHPVVNVDWHEATAFCRWAGGRLPTAVEWEYAAKGGRSRIYPWGNNPATAQHANCANSYCDDRFARTAPVGSFPAGDTRHGLKDMAGNVREWTSSDYDWPPSDYVLRKEEPQNKRTKETRGGSWQVSTSYLRVGLRSYFEPREPVHTTGFRCAQCPDGTEWNGSACVGKQLASQPVPTVAFVGSAKRAGETWRDSHGITWVWMPAGDFHKGCEPQDTQCKIISSPIYNGEPRRRRTVDGFWMMQTETTVAAYKACVDAGGCPADQLDSAGDDECNGPDFRFTVAAGHVVMHPNERSDHPMNCVDFSSAIDFCKWVGGMLPTAVEWEYAAKSGGSRIYPWGDDAVTGRRANFCDANCPSALDAPNKEMFHRNGWITLGEDDGWAGTAPVGSFPQGDTPWGLKDMAGNVCEWTWAPDDQNHVFGEQCFGRSWRTTPAGLRAGDNEDNGPDERLADVGFRCVQ